MAANLEAILSDLYFCMQLRIVNYEFFVGEVKMKKTRGQLERDDRNALKALDWLVSHQLEITKTRPG